MIILQAVSPGVYPFHEITSAEFGLEKFSSNIPEFL